MNDGRVNLLGIGAPPISIENGDWATRRNAQLIASMVVFRGRLSSGEIESRSSYSRERSQCRWDPDWWDPVPWGLSTLSDLSLRSLCSLLWCLPLAYNSKSLTNLRRCSSFLSFCSNSSSFLSKRLHPEALDIFQYVWNDPSLRPNCPSSSCSLSSRLFCLLSRHVDPYEDLPKPLSA